MNDTNSRTVLYLVDIYDFILAKMYFNQRLGRDGFQEMEAGVGTIFGLYLAVLYVIINV